MMPDLEKIYDLEFFKEWGRTNKPYIDSATHISRFIYKTFKPSRIVDVGCGCGVYSQAFRNQGCEVVSIDGVKPPPAYSYPIDIEIRDITQDFENVWGAFDFALCLEVAEHIPEHLSDIFLTNVTRLSDRLILSAAPPNQGGHHHVNEQPKRYWVNRLLSKGFVYNRKKTGALFEQLKIDKPAFMWMCEHISVYEKAKAGDDLKRELPFAIRKA